MGRLVGYGPGEIEDRLTILDLKIAFGEQAGKNVQHFRVEQKALLEDMRYPFTADSAALADVNRDLWEAENDLRERRSRAAATAIEPFCVPIAALAFRIQDLNDRRAELVAKINASAGVVTGPEKLHV